MAKKMNPPIFRVDGKVLDFNSMSPEEEARIRLFYADRLAYALGYERESTIEEVIARVRAKRLKKQA